MCRGWMVYKNITQEKIKTAWFRPWNTWKEEMLENAMLEEYKDHVNSIYSLYSIIKYHYRKKLIEQYLPFRIKFFDLNLFYNVHIIK